jgi:hypothetical protein
VVYFKLVDLFRLEATLLLPSHTKRPGSTKLSVGHNKCLSGRMAYYWKLSRLVCFYGEEDLPFIYCLRTIGSIQYLPAILVQHRVNLKDRKNDLDYSCVYKDLASRLVMKDEVNSITLMLRKFLEFIWMQLKLKVLEESFTQIWFRH